MIKKNKEVEEEEEEEEEKERAVLTACGGVKWE